MRGLIDRLSRLRTVRLLFIIGFLFAVGFSITGLLIEEWVFSIVGFFCGILFFGMGFGFNHVFQKKDYHIILLKYLRPVFYLFLTIQILIVIINLSLG